MKIVLDQKQIEEAYKKVGEEITEDLKNEEKRPIFLCVMKGAMTFLIGMAKYVKLPVIYDYIHISSYDGTSSTGNVKLLKDMTFNPKGRTVVIVEDVIDTGLSLAYLKKHIEGYNPKQVKIACFVDKPARRQNDLKPDYCGVVFKENKYLCGNGFDYYDISRNIPFVFTPDEEDFKKWDELMKRDPLEKL